MICREFCFPFLLSLFVCGLAAGSSPASDTSRKTSPAGQSSDSAKRTDPRVLKRGVTTRHEVQEKLGWAGFSLESERIYLARLMLSKAKGLVRRYGVAQEDGVREGGRDWKSVNALLRFDTGGVLEDYRVLDGAHLIPALGAWMLATNFPAVDLARSLPLPVGYAVAYLPLVTVNGQLILSADSLELAGTAHGIPGFHMPRSSLLQVVEDHQWETEQGRINCRLTFDDKLRANAPEFPSANPILLRFDAQSLLKFLRYLAQTGYSFPAMRGAPPTQF